MRRALLTLALLPLVVMAPTQALPVLVEEDGMPQGWRALENIVTFAMTYPTRFGESPTMALARDDLAARLDAMGYQVERHDYGQGVNIVGILPGTTRPHDWVVVSAHYDTAVTPFNGIGVATHGAWDDGSGVAAALEIARVATERAWNDTIAIVFFDDEESGLVGSSRFVPAYNGKAWNGGNVRLVANLNMDPPGLNWPCVAESGVVMPVTLMQWRANGPGATLLRQFAFDARVAEGVPDEAFEYYNGAFPVGYVLSGVSDNVAFGNRGVPDLYVGSATHLRLADSVTAQPLYPLHSPADTIATMAAWCGGALKLAGALQVEMRIVWWTLVDVDEYGAFPTP